MNIVIQQTTEFHKKRHLFSIHIGSNATALVHTFSRGDWFVGTINTRATNFKLEFVMPPLIKDPGFNPDDIPF